MVTGRGAEISGALLGDPRLAAVTFTGSNEVGEGLRAALAHTNVRFQGELGGKNATVVLSDADLGAAAKAVAAAGLAQAYQRCTATSRVVVERPVYEEFTALLLAEAATLRVGPGLAMRHHDGAAGQRPAAGRRPLRHRARRQAGRDGPHAAATGPRTRP